MAREPLRGVLSGIPANLAALVDKGLHQCIRYIGSKPRIRIVVENLRCPRFSPSLNGKIFLNAVDHLLPLKSLLKNGIRIGVAMKPARPEMLMRGRSVHQVEFVDDQLDHLPAL